MGRGRRAKRDLHIHLNCSAKVIGAPVPAISLLFIPKTLDMNDIGNWKARSHGQLGQHSTGL